MLKWFKFYGSEYLSDPKVRNLTAVQHSCWIHLLCFASTSSTPGVVEHLNEESLLRYAGVTEVTPGVTRRNADELPVLETFENLGMIRREGGKIFITNWEKRQESNLTNAERQAHFRKRQKENSNEIVTKKSRKGNARIDKNRIDSNNVKSTDNFGNKSQGDFNGKEIGEMIDLFKLVNPSYDRLFAMRTQRSAVQRMLEKFGKEKLSLMIQYLPKSNAARYAPTVTTPLQLELNLGKLIAWAQKEKDTGKKTPIAFT